MKREKLEFESYSAIYQLCIFEYVPYPLMFKILMKKNVLMAMKIKHTGEYEGVKYGRCSINDIFPPLQTPTEYYCLNIPFLSTDDMSTHRSKKYFKALLWPNNVRGRTFLSLCLILKFVAERKRNSFRITKKSPTSLMKPQPVRSQRAGSSKMNTVHSYCLSKLSSSSVLFLLLSLLVPQMSMI